MFPGQTRLDIPCDRVCNAAAQADLVTVLVVGWDNDGDFYMAASTSNLERLLYLAEISKTHIFKL